jgi:transporter family protein
MADWVYYSLLSILFWGFVGLFQKLGASRISADSLLVWLMAGYILTLPYLLATDDIFSLSSRDIFIGVLGGITNGLGSWFLFAALENGAKASVAIPLTALYPLLTILLAVVFLAERLTPLQGVGILFAIVAGVLISYETPGTAPSEGQ